MNKGRLIYGGSFNPVHIGHIRMALEALSLLVSLIDIVEFLPSAAPPHKINAALLPFDLRAKMINASIADIAGLICNPVEASLPLPSYTIRTMETLAESTQGRLYFLLGSSDYQLLAEWKDGLRLPEICNLVVAPRGDYSLNHFKRDTIKYWPLAAEATEGPCDQCTGEHCWQIELPCKSRVFLLPTPHLEISSTRARQLWLCGKNLDYLIPKPALDILNSRATAVRSCWQEKKCSM